MAATDDDLGDWPPAGCPPLAWPELPDAPTRDAWYAAVIGAYQALWEGHSSSPVLRPVGAAAVEALQRRLGCALPAPLRDYHLRFGALSLAESLLGVDDADTGIRTLVDAFPGIADIADIADGDTALLSDAASLVAFGDGLGNGNHFCFHRDTGEVFHFDHDTAPTLSRFFPSVQTYLDALMLRCLAEVHDDDDAGEALLLQRFGKALVTKWLY